MAGVLLRAAGAQLRGGAALTAMALTGAGAGLLFSGTLRHDARGTHRCSARARDTCERAWQT